MKKIILYTTISIFLFIFLNVIFSPSEVNAVSISPSPIGDLDVGQAKEVTVAGLAPGGKYYWKESKLTSTIPIKGYTTVFTDCPHADNSGKLQRDLGPFLIPGVFMLEIFKTGTSCEPSGDALVWQEFSVGGPSQPNQSCCELPAIIYDKDKDLCKTQLIGSSPESPTKCTAAGTYCEPESLQCFKTKSSLIGIGGKVCKNPKDNDFDSNKHVVCSKTPGIGCDSNPNNPGIPTAIGCIHTNPVDLIADVLKFALGIGGGLAFLMMLLGAFQMITSSGNPETLQAGKDRLTSAVIGLLLIIFAVLLLQIIGVDILKIPGFGR